MLSKNIIFTGPNTVEVHSETIPCPGPNQVLIRTEYSLISTGTETIVLGGKFEPGSHWDNWVKYPFRPGYCAVGVVEAAGEEVSRFPVGTRIATRTSHAQFALVNDDDPRAAVVPKGVPVDEVPWYAMANIAQIGVRQAGHQLGDAVVLIGAGLLGQLVTQYARLSGAREIIVIDSAPQRLQLAKEHGATHTLQMDVQEAKPLVWESTGGLGADVVYDITGHPAVFAAALGLVRSFGKLQLLGDAPRPSEQHLSPDLIRRGIRITGAHDGYPPPIASDRDPWSHEAMAQLFFTYLRQERMRVKSLVSHRFSPDDAPQAYEMLVRDRSAALGVLFDWGS